MLEAKLQKHIDTLLTRYLQLESCKAILGSLVSDGLISLQDGAKRAGLSESEFAKYLNK